jgi:hypothetical protein
VLHRPALLATLLLLGACASPDGPGSLESASPLSGQPVATVQTAPLPSPVASQPLGTPGTPVAQTAQTSQQPGTLGTLSVPTNQPTTLQDYSRTTEIGQPLGQPAATPQTTLQDAVSAGLDQSQVAPSLTPAVPQWPRVSLAPISTAPEPQATQLFDAIDDATYRRGMQLAFFGDETAQYVVRSQVSAIPADQVTSLIYVFDIFDARGTLRHRVSGARSIPRSGPDGWALVDQATLQSVADDVAGRMMQWFLQNPS